MRLGHSLKKGEFNVSASLNKHDIWIGAYWHWNSYKNDELEVFVCIIPCIPLRFTYRLRDWESDAWEDDTA